jgi:glutamine synthetase
MRFRHKMADILIDSQELMPYPVWKPMADTAAPIAPPKPAVARRKAEILEAAERAGVKFMRLQFTDILGVIKNVEVPERQFAEALDGRIVFDGSSIEGFVRIEESDMFLRPDLDTFRVYPWPSHQAGGKVGRLICDIVNPDGSPSEACPRSVLTRAIARAAEAGVALQAGPEIEFFLFQMKDGAPTTLTHDAAGYFDLTPVDRGEDVRREIVMALEATGFQVEAAHHEVAAGQHEIDLCQEPVLTAADNISTFRLIVKHVALRNGLHATFMPKPIFGAAGSGLHIHQTLIRDGRNAFDAAHGEWQLSATCLHYLGGLLRHAAGLCAITNPLVNSYKRLVPGYEAPTSVAWSQHNRSPLLRVPAGRGEATRVELRMPDPSCNPYLALAVMLRAGLDGIEHTLDPGPPINKDISRMSFRERRHLRIDDLPVNLAEALDALEKDNLVRDALGESIFASFLEAKRAEWDAYIRHVSPWETERYLKTY